MPNALDSLFRNLIRPSDRYRVARSPIAGLPEVIYNEPVPTRLEDVNAATVSYPRQPGVAPRRIYSEYVNSKLSPRTVAHERIHQAQRLQRDVPKQFGTTALGRYQSSVAENADKYGASNTEAPAYLFAEPFPRGDPIDERMATMQLDSLYEWLSRSGMLDPVNRVYLEAATPEPLMRRLMQTRGIPVSRPRVKGLDY